MFNKRRDYGEYLFYAKACGIFWAATKVIRKLRPKGEEE